MSATKSLAKIGERDFFFFVFTYHQESLRTSQDWGYLIWLCIIFVLLYRIGNWLSILFDACGLSLMCRAAESFREKMGSAEDYSYLTNRSTKL